MKTIATLVIALCMGTASLNAQVLIALVFGDNLNSDGLEFGIHAGIGFANMSGIEGSKYRGKLNLGFYFDIKLTEKIWVHPEVLVKTGAGARNLTPYETGNDDLDALLDESKLQRDLGYVQVPILMKYKFVPGWSVEAGIQPALLLFKAKDVFTDIVFEKEDLTFERNVKDEYTRLDFGFAGGFSWRPRKDRGVTIVARYTHGMVNVLKDDSQPAQRNRQFLVGATIPIGVKKAEARRAAKDLEESGANSEGDQ